MSSVFIRFLRMDSSLKYRDLQAAYLSFCVWHSRKTWQSKKQFNNLSPLRPPQIVWTQHPPVVADTSLKPHVMKNFSFVVVPPVRRITMFPWHEPHLCP